MNQSMRNAYPVIILVLICAFVYIYFFYLKGGAPASVVSPATENERAVEGVPQELQNNERQLEGQVQDNAAETFPAVSPQNPVNQPNQIAMPQGNPDKNFPAQPNLNAPMQQPVTVPDKALIEGHWIGGEVIPLTPAIAKANAIPPEVVGVLLDEVTLLSAASGLFAGDVITAINGRTVTDLKSFQQATKDVAQSNRATVSVYRDGKNKDIMVFSTETLGVAQMEAAPMINATARSPHAYYGPCEQCHIISPNATRGKTALNTRNALNPNELLKDAGDNLTKVAPNIRAGTPPPHRPRGTCTLCHVVL